MKHTDIRSRVNVLSKLVFALLASFAFSLSVSYSQTQTQKAVNADISTYIKGYYESLPVDYASNTTKKYPLLIFLHGSGERGNGTTQLPLVLKNGPPRVINDGKFPSSFTVGGKQYSFIVISPQYSSSSDYVTSVKSLINYCKSKYRVDETKIYLTGLSMGGLLTFNLCGSSQTNSELFAAILLVCAGNSPTEGRIANIAKAKLPVWATNNSADPLNAASLAEKTVSMLNAYVPAPPKAVLTVFDKSGHDAWTATYDPTFKQNGLNVYEWMLSYSRGSMATPAPAPPVAEAGANQTITLPASTVTLDGSKSTAASGYSIKTYAWSKTSGPAVGTITTPSGKTTTVTGLTTAGTYVFQLKVTDSNGSTATDKVTIVVNAAPSTASLTANAGADQTVTMPTRTATLNGTKSTAGSGGSIKSYAWTKVSGPGYIGEISNASASTTAITNLVPGVFVYKLTVTDNAGKTATDEVTITVKYRNGVLKANAGPDQTVSYPLTEPLVFDGSASTAPSTSTVSCGWKRLSGPGSSGAVMYPSGNLITTTSKSLPVGTYVYMLIMEDENRNTTRDTMVITIKDPAAKSNDDTPPTAKSGASQTITLPTNSVMLDGSKSAPAPGHTIKSYLWVKKSGPDEYKIVNPNSAETAVTGLVGGEYEFQIQVTGSNDVRASSRVTITVLPAEDDAKPTAKSGASQTIMLPTNSVMLDGSKSAPAPGHTIKSYLWVKKSGPDEYKIVNPNSAETAVTGLAEGEYEFQIQVTGSNDERASSRVTITVLPSDDDAQPTAKSGASQTITLPTNSVMLDGSKSAPAPGHTIKSYLWVKKSGPDEYKIVNPDSAETAVTGLVAGEYEFQIQVMGSNDVRASSRVTITVLPAVSARTAGANNASEVSKTGLSNVDVTAELLKVTVNPNPVTTNMTVWIDGSATGKTSVLVYNLQGALLFQQSFVKDISGKISKSFNVAQLPAGTYFVKVMVDNKATQSIQMIKQ
ncbi:MAG: T9SS type A sorting domain-containing protein [Chitinophagaceae bacterium]|nr:T9SS type A sorting domain-containing protein [Chitinophagaceae bacterium]